MESSECICNIILPDQPVAGELFLNIGVSMFEMGAQKLLNDMSNII